MAVVCSHRTGVYLLSVRKGPRPPDTALTVKDAEFEDRTEDATTEDYCRTALQVAEDWYVFSSSAKRFTFAYFGVACSVTRFTARNDTTSLNSSIVERGIGHPLGQRNCRN